MRSPLAYLLFGALVLASYWFTAHRGLIYYRGAGTPSPPSARSGPAGRVRPTFWSTGYQGGK